MLVLSARCEVSERNALEKARRRIIAAQLRDAREIEAKNRELNSLRGPLSEVDQGEP